MSSGRVDRVRGALGFRLGLWYAVVFLGSSLLLVAVTYLLLAASLRQRDQDAIRGTLARYAAAYDAGGLERLDRAIAADRVAGSYEPMFVRVLAGDAQAVYLSMPADWSRFDLAQLAAPIFRTRDWAELPAEGGGPVLEVASARLDGGTLFQVGKSTERRSELLERFRRTLLLVLLLIVLIGLAGGYGFTVSAMRPIRALSGAVRKILETGGVDARVPVRESGDAVDDLSALFNAMLDRIESLISGMRASLDNVAHDLRTPMMRLRATAETALQQPGQEPDACREALADCLEETERVTAMLEILMDISEAETGTMKLQLERVDLAALVKDAVDLYADVAEEKGLALHTRAPDGVCVMADRNRLRQVAANLLDNAVKYTPRGGRVDLEGRLEGAEAALVVRDTGVGIPAEDVPRIWDRLYRGDRSRSERGLGLGLSLVKAVVEAHKGRVTVLSAPGEGASFTVHLPACPTVQS